MSLVNKSMNLVLGDPTKREMKRYRGLVEDVNELEPEMEKLSDAELAAKIAEMKAGEGKTLVATLPLYLNALQWRGAHLVTVNDYLARRDAGWNGPLYHMLGISVGVISGQDLSFIYDPDFLDETHPDPRLQ